MPRAGATVLASLLRGLLRAARHYGMDEAAIARKLGVDPGAIEELDARIPYATLMAAWELIGRRSGDEWFGLRFAERFVEARTFHLIGLAARRSATIGEALELVVRFSRLINEATDMRLERVRGGVVLLDGPAAGPPWPRHYAEATLAAFIALGRRWVGPAMQARRVGFQHAAPKDPGPLEDWFGCPVLFGQKTNRLEFADEVVRVPFPDPDPELRDHLEAHARALLSALSPQGLIPRVRAAVRAELPRGARLEEVARRVGMSKRTLQRRLAEEGLDHESLVDEERCGTALLALEVPGTSVRDAARAAGYADERAFRRACRRWTGVSPSELRGRPARLPAR